MQRILMAGFQFEDFLRLPSWLACLKELLCTILPIWINITSFHRGDDWTQHSCCRCIVSIHAQLTRDEDPLCNFSSINAYIRRQDFRFTPFSVKCSVKLSNNFGKLLQPTFMANHTKISTAGYVSLAVIRYIMYAAAIAIIYGPPV